MNLCVSIFEIMFSFPSAIYLEGGLVDPMEVVFLIFFLGTCFCMMVVPLYVPTSTHQGSHFPISLPTLLISCLSDGSHPNRYEVASHCAFHLYFPNE